MEAGKKRSVVLYRNAGFGILVAVGLVLVLAALLAPPSAPSRIDSATGTEAESRHVNAGPGRLSKPLVIAPAPAEQIEPAATMEPDEPSADEEWIAIEGIVLSVAGMNLANASIASRTNPPILAISDNQGRYSLRVPAGFGAQLPEGPGNPHLGFFLDCTVEGGIPTAVWVQVSPSEKLCPSAAYEVNITVPLAYAIEGVVVGPDGEGVSKCVIECRSTDVSPEQMRTGVTGLGGRFSIEGMMSGKWKVRAIPQSAWREGNSVAEVELLPAEATVLAGDQGVRIALQKPQESMPRGTLRVKLVDASGNDREIKKGSLSLSRLPSGEQGTNEAIQDGWVVPLHRANDSTYVHGVPPGKWRVWIETADWYVRYADVEVPGEGGELDVQMILSAPGALKGVIVKNGFELDPKARILLRPRGTQSLPYLAANERTWSNGRLRVELPVKPDGSFESPQMMPGEYDIEYKGEMICAIAVSTIESGDCSKVELPLQRTGRLRFESETPVPKGFAFIATARLPSPPLVLGRRIDDVAIWKREVSVIPGEVWWHFGVGTDPVFSRGQLLIRDQLGKAVVQSGEEIRVVVPIESPSAEEDK